MKRASFVMVLVLLLPLVSLAQAPANAPASKVAVIDFNRVVTESANGKKAVTSFNGEVAKLQTEFESLQKQIADNEEKLRTGQNVLSDAVKADLSKKIETDNTLLTRKNEDAQKIVADKQNELFGPVAQIAKAVLDKYAAEAGYSVVFDTSSQANNIIYHNEVADITTEVIRRVDAESAPKP